MIRYVQHQLHLIRNYSRQCVPDLVSPQARDPDLGVVWDRLRSTREVRAERCVSRKPRKMWRLQAGSGPGTHCAEAESMRLGVAPSISFGMVVSLAAFAASGCGSSAPDASSASAEAGAAGGSSQAGGSSEAGSAGAGRSGSAGSGGAVGAASAGSSGNGGSAGASGLACPAAVPTAGAVCSVAGVCNYSDCAGAGQSAATCDGANFSVTTTPCQATPCGMTGFPQKALSCMPNEICIEHQGGNVFYECRPDPCAPNAQACGCAASLCGANTTCSFQNSKLICACVGGCA